MKIVFACGSGGPGYPWADPLVATGIGGSEECVILLSRELAARGHDVWVYNNCADYTGVYHGVTYRPYQDFEFRSRNEDVLVAWRNWYLLIGSKARHKWLWCHDIPAGCHCPCYEEIVREDSAFNHIDKFILLNNYHRSVYSHIPDDKIHVIPIGVDTRFYESGPDIQREPGRVLYFSHPNRGLDRLREVWPQVRREVPNATLASFWWEPEHWRSPVPELGILPMQKLGHAEIAEECFKADIFGYPSVFAPEISPATTIKAQMGGAYPVVVIQGGMCDTVQFGIRTTQDQFAGELIGALRRSAAGDLEMERLKMHQWALDTYSWASVAKRWLSHLE